MIYCWVLHPKKLILIDRRPKTKERRKSLLGIQKLWVEKSLFLCFFGFPLCSFLFADFGLLPLNNGENLSFERALYLFIRTLKAAQAEQTLEKKSRLRHKIKSVNCRGSQFYGPRSTSNKKCRKLGNLLRKGGRRSRQRASKKQVFRAKLKCNNSRKIKTESIFVQICTNYLKVDALVDLFKNHFQALNQIWSCCR